MCIRDRLRRDNQVVYGVYQLYSTCNDNITLISHQKVTDFGPKWSFLLILTVFDLSRPPEGHYDPCVVLRHEKQVVYGVSQLYSTCNGPRRGHCVTENCPKMGILLVFTVFDVSRPPEGIMTHSARREAASLDDHPKGLTPLAAKRRASTITRRG